MLKSMFPLVSSKHGDLYQHTCSRVTSFTTHTHTYRTRTCLSCANRFLVTNLNCDTITANSYLWLEYICSPIKTLYLSWISISRMRMFWKIRTDLFQILSKPPHCSRRYRYRNEKRKDIDTLSISLWSWITHAAPLKSWLSQGCFEPLI